MGEGDIPLWIFSVSGDSVVISNGKDAFLFLVGNGGVHLIGSWSSPLPFDDMMLWRGKLYALSKGTEVVYVLGGDGEILDSIVVPYRYLSHLLGMFRTLDGVYLDLPGDSSYSIVDGKMVVDPVFIRRRRGKFLVKDHRETFYLPGDVVSVSFIGEDSGGRKYLMVERVDGSGVETGISVLDGNKVRIEWLGQFEMEGYIPRPLEVDLRRYGAVYMLVPLNSGLRFLSWIVRN